MCALAISSTVGWMRTLATERSASHARLHAAERLLEFLYVEQACGARQHDYPGSDRREDTKRADERASTGESAVQRVLRDPDGHAHGGRCHDDGCYGARVSPAIQAAQPVPQPRKQDDGVQDCRDRGAERKAFEPKHVNQREV